MIVEAMKGDIPAIVEMGKAFHAMSPHRDMGKYDPIGMANVLSFMIESPSAVVLFNGNGAIGGILAPVYFNPAKIILEESFWWAEEGGRDLLKAFEAWGRANGADFVSMCTLVNEKSAVIGRVMRMNGYRPVETRYIKGL
jgi:hypothetical protein